MVQLLCIKFVYKSFNRDYVSEIPLWLDDDDKFICLLFFENSTNIDILNI